MDNKDAKQCHRLFLSELATMVVCGYLVYLLSTTLEGGLDIRLILPGGRLNFYFTPGLWLTGCTVTRLPLANRSTGQLFFGLFFPAQTGYTRCDRALSLVLLVLLFADRSALFVPFNLFGLILLIFLNRRIR